ncbi:ABC transporter permease [Halomonas sp. QX-2]|jgi:putative spermidine/putrescine transport system permease protein|uniref:ABC transporter permease n=1 Tax=Vreelandella sedimenti TaxID=2729618 RepID=A0A7Z0N657_9GAMM|nr:ABC transporter permease [Halomonas sedimenti]NYT72192.1 ABC transporter permease [Halomonas sedimenti]|tara:strand:+ start:6043 stop:6831 length:789 start_codon:yes stop_codon:yes gene_type:complete
MNKLSLSRISFIGYVALVLTFLILPLLIVVPMSFSDSRFLSFPPSSFSFRWYETFFSNPGWMSAAKTSLIVAFSTALIATPIGVAAAYAINNSSHWLMRYLKIVLLLPLIVPIIIVATGVFFIYALSGMLYTIPGLIMADVMLALPYVITAVTAGLHGFDQTQEMVARSLGMNRFRAFMSVTLPQIMPSVMTGAIFAFIQALDETMVALFISGGQNQPLTVRMFTALRDEIDPTIAAISTLLTAASFALVLLLVLARKQSPA